MRGIMASNTITIEKSILKSLAFKKLSGSGKFIYFQFLLKRKMEEIPKKSGKWVNTNRNELVFTHYDAEKIHKYSSTKFVRAIDELILYGFIDIMHHGGMSKGNYSLYSLSTRWQRFGKNDFVDKARKPIVCGRGFTDKKKSYTQKR
jgi:hypothetical protein